MILDDKFSFASHINEKISKAHKGLGVIKSLSHYFSVKTMDQRYSNCTYDLDFCDVIYHINLNYLVNTLGRIQYHAALAITGTWKGTNQNKIYEELGWESLSDRRWSRRIFHYYKIENNLTHPYLRTPIPPIRTHLFGSRSENVQNEIRCKSKSYSNSFYPDSIRCWNKIGPELCNSLNLKCFKSSILSLVRPPQRECLTSMIRWVLSGSINYEWGLVLSMIIN